MEFTIDKEDPGIFDGLDVKDLTREILLVFDSFALTQPQQIGFLVMFLGTYCKDEPDYPELVGKAVTNWAKILKKPGPES